MTVTALVARGGAVSFQIRDALPNDAPRIAALYEASYSSADGRHPTENYPFPQILDPEWVECAIEAKMILWLVAESESGLIGAAGLLRGLGSKADAIGECFGLVVDRRARCNGLGTSLMAALRDLAFRTVEVAIGQMRTAEPAVSHVVRKCGFQPIGFEPFVHHMLAGTESMVAVAIISPAALAQRRRARATTQSVRRLAEAVLNGVDSPLLQQLPAGRQKAEVSSPRGGLRFKEVDEEIGADLMRRLRASRGAPTDFVDLRRMDELGRAASRRKQRYFAGIVGGKIVACLHAAHNRHDHHLRIESFAAESPDLQEPMLRELLELIEPGSEGSASVVVAEVVAENLAQQRVLETLGFSPTLYYPALVSHRARRMDVVQYTRLQGYSVSEALVKELGWPAAEHVIQTVATELQRRSEQPRPRAARSVF
jgi:RimJ/RimL family protein N-acetyltransferase